MIYISQSPQPETLIRECRTEGISFLQKATATMKHLDILLLCSVIVAAPATPWTYRVTLNPPIHWVSLVDDPLAVDVSSELGDDSDV